MARIGMATAHMTVTSRENARSHVRMFVSEAETLMPLWHISFRRYYMLLYAGNLVRDQSWSKAI